MRYTLVGHVASVALCLGTTSMLPNPIGMAFSSQANWLSPMTVRAERVLTPW